MVLHRVVYSVSCRSTDHISSEHLKDMTRSAIGSTHRCCAERNLISQAVCRARKKGVRRERIIPWIKRTVRDVFVFRLHQDGKPAVSCPCFLCRDQLIRYDLRVSYIDADGNVVSRARANDLPEGVRTTSQKTGRAFH